MYIRHSSYEDLPEMLRIYEYARNFMAEHGNPRQWGDTNWPPKHLLEKDIAAGRSYVVVAETDRNNEHICGTFYFDSGVDIEPTYRVIEEGEWPDPDLNYGVIHRIATDGTERGVGALAMNYAKQRTNGHVRIDTHPDNVVMQGMLEKNGFVKCGIIHVEEDDMPRFAYEYSAKAADAARAAAEERYTRQLKAAQAMRIGWKINDDARDAGLTPPDDVISIENIVYGPYGLANALDIYYPDDATGKLPVIISIHGGGWAYGDKTLYRYYCMALAHRGFAVIDFNYRLAPEDPFPAAFCDVNRAVNWVACNGGKYGFDLNNVFILGDSAGGQMASWYATLMSSASYRKLYAESFPLVQARRTTPAFSREEYERQLPKEKIEDIPDGNMLPDENYAFIVPHEKISLRACALNCGVYDMVHVVDQGVDDMFCAFLGDMILPENAPSASSLALVKRLIDSWSFQDENFPPAFVMSAANDFLLPMAEPMARHLTGNGSEAELHIYGEPELSYMGHVFHVNQKLKEADQCNDDECAFFRRHLDHHTNRGL